MPDELYILELITIIIAGLLFGSFSTALVYRIPRDIPWIFDKDKKACRSACPKCGTTLHILDLVPVFSWLFMRGRCRSCKEKISPIYPLIELTTLCGFIAVFILAGFTFEAIPLYLLVPFLVALIYIDLEHFILPNELVAIVAALGGINLITVYGRHNIHANTLSAEEMIVIEYILGGAILYGALSWFLGFAIGKFLKKEAMGFGDVKFFAAAGLWLGLSKLHSFMILSGIFGVAFAIVWRFCGKGEVFPFGPALIAAFFSLLFINGSLLP